MKKKEGEKTEESKAAVYEPFKCGLCDHSTETLGKRLIDWLIECWYTWQVYLKGELVVEGSWVIGMFQCFNVSSEFTSVVDPEVGEA